MRGPKASGQGKCWGWSPEAVDDCGNSMVGRKRGRWEFIRWDREGKG